MEINLMECKYKIRQKKIFRGGIHNMKFANASVFMTIFKVM